MSHDSPDVREMVRTARNVLSRFLTLVEEDDELRAGLRDLTHAMASLVQGVMTAAPPLPAPPHDSQPWQAAASVEPAPMVEQIAEGTVAQASGTPGRVPPVHAEEGRPRTSRTAPPREDELPVIEARCRLKAEGARWAKKRQHLFASGADFQLEIAPLDRDLISRAKEIEGCFLWMNYPQWQPPSESWLLDELAGAFEGVAEALAAVRAVDITIPGGDTVFERAVDLLAEAQSALRLAVARVNDGKPDSDQKLVFEWLKWVAEDRRIFIQRYMRLNDPADPAKGEDLIARVHDLDREFEELRRRDKERKRLFGKLRYLVSHVSETGTEASRSWESIARTVDEMIGNGILPSSRELREIVLQVIDDIPILASSHPGFEQVLGEIDRFLASRPAVDDQLAAPPPSPEVHKVARLLEGRKIVLIGGDRRPAAREALMKAFGLSELEWLPSREHQSLERFQAAVAHDDVALVLLAIRWASHSCAEVQRFCELADKPIVRLPAGYNPNQVARQILSQCGDRLRNGAHARG